MIWEWIFFGAFVLGMMFFMAWAANDVYGPYLDEEEVDDFLDKHLREYQLNDCNDRAARQMFYHPRLPYIARTGFMIFAKWHIERHGRVFRWSEASKRIDEYHAQLYSRYQPKDRDLSDYDDEE